MGCEGRRWRPFAGRGEADILIAIESIARTYSFTLSEIHAMKIAELRFWFKAAELRAKQQVDWMMAMGMRQVQM